jgi:hypothetical protein
VPKLSPRPITSSSPHGSRHAAASYRRRRQGRVVVIGRDHRRYPPDHPRIERPLRAIHPAGPADEILAKRRRRETALTNVKSGTLTTVLTSQNILISAFSELNNFLYIEVISAK